MVEATNMISAAQSAFFIRNRKQFYQSLESTGYRLPSLRAGMVTLEWMWGVKSKAIYCPKEDEVNRHKRCYSPPPIRDLVAKLETTWRPLIRNSKGKEAAPYEAALNQIVERYPDSKWLVALLGIWKPDDEIF